MNTKYEIALQAALEKDPELPRVFELLNEALAEGDPRAAYALANWYLHGKYVEKDWVRAVKLFRRAAKAKITDAMHDLAICYEKGNGTKKDLRKAYELYVAAALWGDRQCIYEVGRCLYYGFGTRKDLPLGRIWLDRAKVLGID